MVETDEWLPIPEHKPGASPFDGAPVLLRRRHESAFEGVAAVWRDTRAFDTSSYSWMRTGFWAFRNEGGRRIDFEPDAYQRLVE